MNHIQNVQCIINDKTLNFHAAIKKKISFHLKGETYKTFILRTSRLFIYNFFYKPFATCGCQIPERRSRKRRWCSIFFFVYVYTFFSYYFQLAQRLLVPPSRSKLNTLHQLSQHTITNTLLNSIFLFF